MQRSWSCGPAWLFLLPALVLMGGFGAAVAGAQERASWEIHDSLGFPWRDELVMCDVSLPPGLDADAAVEAVDQSSRVLPAQVVGHNDDGAAQVAMILDLDPFEQRLFTFRAAVGNEAGTDLTVKREEGAVWIGTSAIGVQCPVGEGAGVLSEVPAPILAVRGEPGATAGKGWFEGDQKVARWHGEVVAHGPVLAWVRVTYNFAGGGSYVVDIQAPAGQPVVLVREETKGEAAPAGAFHLAFAGELKADTVFSKRELTWDAWHVESGPQFKGQYLTPAQLHFRPQACNIVAAWQSPPGEDLRSDGAPAMRVDAKEAEQQLNAENLPPQVPAVGLFPRLLSHWTNPRDPIPLAWNDEHGLVARSLPATGVREWALFAGNHRDLIVPRGQEGKGRLEGYYPALLLASKWGQTPLNKVKDWILDWGDVVYQPGQSYELASLERETMLYYAHQFLRGGHQWWDTYIHMHQALVTERAGWDGYREAQAKLSPASRLSARAGAAFVMYKQTDQDYWPTHSWIGPSNPNMIYMGNSAIVMGATSIPDHPMAQQWTDLGVESVRQNLTRASSDEGAWLECPGYDGAGIFPILRAAYDLQRTGLGDLLSDGRLLKVAMYHVNLLTPPDPRVGGRRHLPEFGDAFSIETDPTAQRVRLDSWEPLIDLLKDSHPREMGQLLWGMGRDEGPVPIVVPDGRSRSIHGFGSVFRHAFNTPYETYLAVHQDPFGFGHYHFDLGALYLFGRGAPLCTDWPSLYDPQITEAWMHNTVSVGHQARFRLAGRHLPGALLPRVDYSRSRVFHGAWPKDWPVELPAQSWQRQFMLVKSDTPAGDTYLVVRDRVNDERPSEWSLWTLATDLYLTPGRAQVRGQYGVDMTVHFFVGAPQTPHTEMFGFGDPPADADGWRTEAPAPWQHTLASQDAVEHVAVERKHLYQQNVIRMSSESGGEYGAVIFPRDRDAPLPQITGGSEDTVQVVADGARHTVLLYPVPRQVEVEGVAFAGRAGLVCRSDGELELHLVDGDSIGIIGGPSIAGGGPVSLTRTADGDIAIAVNGPARKISIQTAAADFHAQSADEVIVKQSGNTWELALPGGEATVHFTRQR